MENKHKLCKAKNCQRNTGNYKLSYVPVGITNSAQLKILSSTTIFILLLLISSLMVSCKKSPFDYRSKYLGNYEFHITEKGQISNWPPVDKTYVREGRIEASETHDLLFFWNSDIEASGATLYDDASFRGNIIGDFLSASEVVFISTEGAGQGNYFTYNVTGKKTK